MRTVFRIALAMLALFLTCLVVVGITAPANATDYYRYWAYFNVDDGKYVPSEKGVGASVPEDGAIEGYRYAAPDLKKPNEPRIDLTQVDFEAVCAETAAAESKKRVAVVIDFGVGEDSDGQDLPEPVVECAQVAPKATALQVLQSVAEVRTKSSSFGPLLCGIDGYPTKGCADVVTKQATPADAGFLDVALGEEAASDDATDASAEEDDSNAPLYAGLGVVVVGLIAGGVYVTRRRSS